MTEPVSSNVTPASGDYYDTDVSSLIEAGTRFSGPVVPYPTWTGNKDAFLMYNKGGISLDDIVAMRRSDGQARALGNLITLPIRLALQEGRWVAPDSGGAEEEVEFSNLMWTIPPSSGGMTTPVHDLVPQLLLSLFDGFAPFELVSQVPSKGPLKGKKTLRKMAYRDPRTVTLLQDAHGGYAGFRQVAHMPGGVVTTVLSPKKTALFTVNGHENPHYGVSFFESAYPHYEAKRKWYYLSEMAGQFAAVPGRIGEIPQNARKADALAFKQALENFYFNTTMVHKTGYKVTPFNTMSGFDFLKYIDHHNFMMSKSVLASFFESQQRTVLVENSTQDASADLFLLAMETLANSFASVLTNHVMPKYIDENFNTGKYPVFKPGPLSDNAKRQISSLFDKVAISGILNTTPELVRELEKNVSRDLGLDVDYEEIEKREMEAALQSAEMAEALAAQTQMETLDQERASEGGVPNNPMTNSGPANQPDAASTTEQAQQQDNPQEAAMSTVSLTPHYYEALDAMYQVAQNVFTGVEYPVDKGFDGTL